MGIQSFEKHSALLETRYICIIYIYMYIHIINIRVCMYVYINICIYIYTYVKIFRYIYIYIHNIYIYIDIYTYVYITRGLKHTVILSSETSNGGPLLKVPAKPGDFASPPPPTWA